MPLKTHISTYQSHMLQGYSIYFTMDSSSSWKNHIDGFMIKLSKECYAIRSLRPFMSYESLRMIYYSYFHTVMSYGIMFWSHSNSIFKLQKKDYNNYKLQKLGLVLPFKTNLELYEINTRNKKNFHPSQPRLSIYRNGVYYLGIKTFNYLSSYIKNYQRIRTNLKIL
jgi:hypothetical protein